MPRRPALTLEARPLARMLKALGSPVRVHVFTCLVEHPTLMTREIVAATPRAQSTVGQPLKVLRVAGLIQGEIEGPPTGCCLDPKGLHRLDEQFQGWAGARPPAARRPNLQPTPAADKEHGLLCPSAAPSFRRPRMTATNPFAEYIE